jgi:hypothetical protein
MRKLLVVALAVALASPAFGQQYKWTDSSGHVQYGDVPPPGVKATRLRGGPTGPAPAAPKADAKGAAKGPLSPAEQEAAFRKRQLDEHKAQEKAQQDESKQIAKQENCTNAQAQLAQLESGQRIMQFDAKGERHFMDDSERAAQIAKARQSMNEWCK